MALRFTVLGPVAGVRDGTELSLGGARQRTALALLLLAGHRSVSTDRLVEGIWGPAAADGSIATLRVFMTNLRKAVGSSSWIQFEGAGYRLGEGHEVDVDEFEELRRQAARAPVAASMALWRAALDCFAGDPLTGVEDTEAVVRERVRLTEARLDSLDELYAAALATGRHGAVVAELTAAVAEHPLRERLRGTLMVALYRQGRQADALRVYQEGRERLIDELGLEPGPELRRLEQLVLAQSPDLEGPQPLATEPTTVDARSAAVPLAWLEAEGGGAVTLTRRVNLVGRGADCDVLLDDSRVSRQHAVVRWRQGRWEVVDDHSTNGTFVNGDEVETAELADGDELSFGGVARRFRRR